MHSSNDFAVSKTRIERLCLGVFVLFIVNVQFGVGRVVRTPEVGTVRRRSFDRIAPLIKLARIVLAIFMATTIFHLITLYIVLPRQTYVGLSIRFACAICNLLCILRFLIQLRAFKRSARLPMTSNASNGYFFFFFSTYSRRADGFHVGHDTCVVVTACRL